MRDLANVLGTLTARAEDVSTSLYVIKRRFDGKVEYAVYAPYFNCVRPRLVSRFWAFVKARHVLRNDERIQVNFEFSRETIRTACEHGAEHRTRVLRAKLKLETSDEAAIRELLQFEEKIRPYYYACWDLTPKTVLAS